MVILFLVPYLGLSAALLPIAPIIAAQLHTSVQTIAIAAGLANAGYAVGTVLAVQFAQLLPQRRLLLGYGSALVIGSILAAAATGPGMFIAGHVLQGLCTSMLLIAAAPPLFLGFPTAKLPYTAVILNICIFGAVAAGPLVGGAQASFHAWRPLFWIVAGIAALALVMSLLTFQDAPPADRSAPRDGLAIGLAAGGSVAAFWGASELLTHRFLDPAAIVPLLTGLALIIILLVYQYRARRPLLTVRALASTIPVGGIVIAVCAAAAATSAIGLTGTILAPYYTPLHLGLLFLPELAAAILTAFALGAVFSTRFIHAPWRHPAHHDAGAGWLGTDRRRHRRLGNPGAVLGRLFAALGCRAARVRHPRATAGGRRLHDLADLAALRHHVDRTGDSGAEHRSVDLLWPCRRRSVGVRASLRAWWGSACRPGPAAMDGRPGTGVGIAAAAGSPPSACCRACSWCSGACHGWRR